MPRKKPRCAEHGAAATTVVCRHLLDGSGEGFFSDKPTRRNPWPDAWCAVCDEYFRRDPNWAKKPSANLRFVPVCQRCYETIKHTPRKGESKKFTALLDACLDEMLAKNEAQETISGLRKAGRWEFDQQRGDLVFTWPDVIATARAQIVGSYSTRSGSWMWAWANSSIADHLKAHSLRVRKYGLKHRIPQLTLPMWEAEELDSWKMAALACRLCRAQGVYRGPVGTSYLFLTFGKIKFRKAHLTTPNPDKSACKVFPPRLVIQGITP